MNKKIAFIILICITIMTVSAGVADTAAGTTVAQAAQPARAATQTPQEAQASAGSSAFSNDKYYIYVPDGFVTDSETVENYTSISKDNVTIGISTHNNTENENAAKYTETQIESIANDTLDSLKAQSEADIKVTKHEILAFSKNDYPAVHIVYEGKNESGEPLYMEEYLLTTTNYKYTIVLYAGTAADVDTDEIKAATDSFTVLDDPITQAEPADTGSTLMLLIISGSAVLVALIITLFIIIKYKKR